MTGLQNQAHVQVLRMRSAFLFPTQTGVSEWQISSVISAEDGDWDTDDLERLVFEMRGYQVSLET